MSYRDVILADFPVAYWRLGESSGTVLVDELGAHNGTYSGSPRFGRVGAIIGDPDTSVNGANASVPHFAFDTGAFSVEQWVQGHSNSGILVSHQTGSVGWELAEVLVGPNAVWAFRIFSVTISPATSPKIVGPWTHLVGVWDGAVAHLYVNGTHAGSIVSMYTPAATDITVGGAGETGPYDETAIYNYALTPQQIMAHYAEGVRLNHSNYRTQILYDGPEMYLRMDAASGTTELDVTGNGHDGTYSGSPTFNETGAITGDSDKAVTLAGGASLHVPNTASLHQNAPFSVEAWVKNAELGVSYQTGMGNGGVAGWALAANTLSGADLWQWTVAGTPTSPRAQVAEADFAVYHHLVGTWTGQAIQLFVDGVLKASAPLAMFTPETAADLILQLATLDEVAFYPYALSPTQVSKHYAKGAAVSFVHAGHYGPAYVEDRNGNSLAGATFEVFLTDGVTPATLYLDGSRTAATGPFSVFYTGMIEFYVDPGDYNLVVTKNAVVQLDVRVTVPKNPIDG